MSGVICTQILPPAYYNLLNCLKEKINNDKISKKIFRMWLTWLPGNCFFSFYWVKHRISGIVSPVGNVSKIRSLCFRPPRNSLYVSSAGLPLQTASPHCGVNLTVSFHKVETKGLLLPHYCKNQYLLNLQIL